jgi:hypothetical protein
MVKGVSEAASQGCSVQPKNVIPRLIVNSANLVIAVLAIPRFPPAGE